MKQGTARTWVKLASIFGALLIGAHAQAAQPPCTANTFATVASFKQEAPVIACDMAHRRLLVIGEVHGTQQTPAFVAQLVGEASKHRPVRLGIEYIQDMQPAIKTFLRSRGTPADHDALFKIGYWSNRDGRTSVAMMHMIEALRRLRAAGRDVDIFTMKPNYPGETVISKAGGMSAFVNRGLADAVRSQVNHSQPNTLVIAYMGNAHSTANIFATGPEPTVTTQLATLDPTLLILHERGKPSTCDASAACRKWLVVHGPPMHGTFLKHLPSVDGARTIEVAMPVYTDSPPVLKHRPPMPVKKKASA